MPPLSFLLCTFYRLFCSSTCCLTVIIIPPGCIEDIDIFLSVFLVFLVTLICFMNEPRPGFSCLHLWKHILRIRSLFLVCGFIVKKNQYQKLYFTPVGVGRQGKKKNYFMKQVHTLKQKKYTV